MIGDAPLSRLRGATARQAHLRPTVAGVRRGREVISESVGDTLFVTLSGSSEEGQGATGGGGILPDSRPVYPEF